MRLWKFNFEGKFYIRIKALFHFPLDETPWKPFRTIITMLREHCLLFILLDYLFYLTTIVYHVSLFIKSVLYFSTQTLCLEKPGRRRGIAVFPHQKTAIYICLRVFAWNSVECDTWTAAIPFAFKVHSSEILTICTYPSVIPMELCGE